MVDPFEAGATHDTEAWVSPGVALTLVGAPGSPAGVTAVDGVDAGPVPAALVAVTMNVYGVPSVSPVTAHGLAEHVVVAPPGYSVTV
jgi:hypothetical protein